MINDALLPDDVRSYIRKHELDVKVAEVLNDVLKEMPKDPLEHVVCGLARHSVSAPTFLELRRDPRADAPELKFQFFAEVCGQRVLTHSFALGGCLRPVPEAPPAEPPPEAPQEGSEEEASRAMQMLHQVRRLQNFIEERFAESLKGRCVNDLLALPRLCDWLAAAPIPAGLQLEAAEARALLLEALLAASAGATDRTRLEVLQHQLELAGAAPSPPLRSPEALSVWRERWPRLALPVFHGGGPSVLKPPGLRVCAALAPLALGSALAVAPAHAAEAAESCPALGWVVTVAAALHGAVGEAVKLLQAEKASAALVVDGVPYGHAGGLQKTLDLTQDALKRAAGDAAMPTSCGVLVAAAEEAWSEEEEVYELEAGKKLGLEQLAALYTELSASGWLRAVVRPFRENDMSAGCELLRAERPDLLLVADGGSHEQAAGAARAAPSGAAAYSGALHLSASVLDTLVSYVATEPAWREAHGYGRCCFLDPGAAPLLPSAVDAVTALGQAEVVVLPADATAEGLATISARASEAPLRALFAPFP